MTPLSQQFNWFKDQRDSEKELILEMKTEISKLYLGFA